MQLTQLKYFLEVQRSGSIREAAKKINVAPSAISRQIANLEIEINMPLFERRPRGMHLTPAGEIYTEYAHRVVAEHDRMISEIEDLMGMQRGHIRIYTVEGVLADFLNKAIVDFRRVNPNVTFAVTTTGTDKVIAGVRSVDADIGLTYYASPDAGVKFYNSLKSPLCALMSPDHVLAGFKKLTLKETAKHPLAIPVKSFGIRDMIDSCCKAEGISFTPALTTNSIEALRGFARYGGGITFISKFWVQRELIEGSLVAIPLEDHILNNAYINTCVVHDRRLPITTSSFLDFLQIEMRLFEEKASALGV